jgi:hypothetical protein
VRREFDRAIEPENARVGVPEALHHEHQRHLPAGLGNGLSQSCDVALRLRNDSGTVEHEEWTPIDAVVVLVPHVPADIGRDHVE